MRLIDADALLMHIADLGFENRTIEGDSVFESTRKMTELFCLNFAEALIRNAPTVYASDWMNEMMIEDERIKKEQNDDTDTTDSTVHD